jgi:glc operon protein GlcG
MTIAGHENITCAISLPPLDEPPWLVHPRLSDNPQWGRDMRNKPCLTAADTAKMMAACVTEAEKNKWSVSISIVDESGFPLRFERMDGAPPISAEVSYGKARTSALTKRPSKFFEDRVKERPAFANFPAGVLIQGGVPVMHQNECVGAIGVSGVQSHEDEQIALAGAKALG